jgi:pimeloyl-ACP methyl ester carboxylesterase
VVLARDDQLTDNAATARAFQRMQTTTSQLLTVPGAHGVQFDAPEETADAIVGWVERFARQSDVREASR